MRAFKKIFALFLSIAIVSIPYATLALLPAQAAVSDWQKGATLVPQSPTDFGSASFDQSLQNLHNTGANAVALVVPYYQSNVNSTDIGPGYNTPTDASLEAAIDYAHSLGMTVTIKMLVDSYDGQWRAFINPSDRSAWFGAYQYYLVHLAEIGQAHHAEMIDIGTELVDMATYAENSTNTQNWISMIQAVRAVYSGKLTYGANSEDATADPYTDEKRFIGFWPELDYVGFSAYYDLTYNGSVSSLEGSWDYWNKNDIASFEQQVGKPIILMEVGYESTGGTSEQPWNWALNNGYDGQEQADDYQALLSYWNNYSYVQGVYFWDWSTSPNAGGSGDDSYTPQNKPAQQIMAQWFGTSTPSTQTSGSTGTFNATVSAPAATVGQQDTLAVSVQSSVAAQGLVDIEAYDQAGNKVFQQFYSNQTFSAGQTLSFSPQWTPSAAGTYTLKVGVFSNDWTQNYYWNGSAATVTASAQSQSNSGSGSNTGSGTGGTFTVTGSATPNSSGAALSVSVKDSSAGSALVDIEAYNQSGAKSFQQYYDNQSFSAGQTMSYTPSATLPAGNYTLEIGVFSPGWSSLEYWDSNAATFTVASGSGSNGSSGSNSGSGSNTGSNGSGNSGSNTGSTSGSGSTTPTGSASIDQNGSSVSAGGTLDFTGRGFAHEESVTVSLNGKTLATAHADGGGNFSTGSITAPSSAGSYTYTFSGSSGDSASATITVH